MSMISNLSQESSQAAVKLLAAVKDLLAARADNDLPIDEDQLRSLCRRVESARTGFPLVLEERVPQAINRLGGVLLGPIFTSAAYPWPTDDDGRFMAPLCQLNSLQFPQVVDGIDGLLQVWMYQADRALGGMLVRVVPTSEVDAALITPVIESDGEFDLLLPGAAEWLRDFHLESKPSKKEYITAAARQLGHKSASALEDADWDEWNRLAEEYTDKHGYDIVPSLQIIGFAEARVYCDITGDQSSEMVGLEKLKKRLEKRGAAGSEGLVRLLAQVVDAYKAWSGILGEQAYPCLLGTFKEIQYRAADKDAPIICFEALGQYEWGDCGNAQVFYSKENGFQFDWSCY